MKHLLVFTPTWIDALTGEQALHPECEAALLAQVLPDDWEFDWHVTADNPYPIGDYRNVLHQYVEARKWFLNSHALDGSPYDALLTLEHDNVIEPSDGIARMLATPADVVYAPYMLRHGSLVLNTWEYIGERNLGESLTIKPRALKEARLKGTWRVSGAGFGCTLIWRHVLERFGFHKGAGLQWCPDLPFAVDCLRAGLVSMAQMDVPVIHVEAERRIHPYTGVGMTKYVATTSVNVMVDGNPLRLELGQEYEFAPGQARDWVRAGYLLVPDIETPPVLEAAVLEPSEQAVAPAQRARKKKAV